MINPTGRLVVTGGNAQSVTDGNDTAYLEGSGNWTQIHLYNNSTGGLLSINKSGITSGMGNTDAGLNLWTNTNSPIKFGTNSAERVRIDASGNVGIGTTTPWRTLSVNGTVGFASLSSVSTNQSAYLCLSSNNEVVQDSTTCLASSARFKQNITPLSASSSLAEVLALHPVSFQYTPAYNGSLQSDPNLSGTFVGFIAEDLAKVDPRLITIDATGTTPTAPYGVRYENVTAILAGAIQDIASISGAFKDSLTAWLADAGNGIEDLFAKNIHAGNITTKELTFTRATGTEIHAQKLCAQKSDGTDVCVTGDQLAALASANQSGGSSTPPPSSSSNASTTSDTPPVIQINGGNPAIIHIGDSYADLGATITGPQADINLGIRTYLNGTLTSNVVIDTSTVATDTIDYVATGQTGLTSTSTRTVIVRNLDSAPSPTDVINPNVATTSPQHQRQRRPPPNRLLPPTIQPPDFRHHGAATKEVQIHMSTVATLAQKIPAEATVSISHEPESAAAITIAIMVMLTVAITVMAIDHHNWMTMPTGISVVISITVSISEVNRYATALFRDHHWPIRRCRSSKRGNGQK